MSIDTIFRNISITPMLTIDAIFSNINEDKRKTECQVHMFEIVKEIEDCPVKIIVHNMTLL